MTGTRSLLLLALTTALGCGNASQQEQASALKGPLDPCGGSGGVVFVAPQLASSTPDPWKGHTGIVVVYGTVAPYIIYGVDLPTRTVLWYMDGATDADVEILEGYPESLRDCSGKEGDVGGGSGRIPPDPRILGFCAPKGIWDDAFAAFELGPFQDGLQNKDYCLAYGEGCAPTTCAAASAECGSIRACGRSKVMLGCGSCGNGYVCGLNAPNVCTYCKPLTCKKAMCGDFDDGCGGTISCSSGPHCTLY